jgi:hypothetical protein
MTPRPSSTRKTPRMAMKVIAKPIRRSGTDHFVTLNPRLANTGFPLLAQMTIAMIPSTGATTKVRMSDKATPLPRRSRACDCRVVAARVRVAPDPGLINRANSTPPYCSLA